MQVCHRSLPLVMHAYMTWDPAMWLVMDQTLLPEVLVQCRSVCRAAVCCVGYARPVADILDPDGSIFAARLYR